MEKIDLHTTDSGKLYIKPEDLFAQDKVQEVIKKAAMKSETKPQKYKNKPDVIRTLENVQYDNAQLRVTLKKSLRYVRELYDMITDTKLADMRNEIMDFIKKAEKL
jgi:hypothetical protein